MLHYKGGPMDGYVGNVESCREGTLHEIMQDRGQPTLRYKVRKVGRNYIGDFVPRQRAVPAKIRRRKRV
jgi:hypothetical protein